MVYCGCLQNWQPRKPRQLVPPHPPTEKGDSPVPDAPSIAAQPDEPIADQQQPPVPPTSLPAHMPTSIGQGSTADLPSAPGAEPSAGLPSGAQPFGSSGPTQASTPLEIVPGPPSMPQLTESQQSSAPAPGAVLQQLQDALSSHSSQVLNLPLVLCASVIVG